MTDLRQQIENAMTSAETQSSEQTNNVATSEDNQAATAEPAEIISAPNSYKQEYKDSFNQLPTEWQKYLSSREKEVEQGLSRARNQYSWVDKTYNDRRDALAAQGYNNAQDFYNDLVLMYDALNNNPTATLDLLRQNYGVESGSTNYNALQRQLSALQQKVSEQQNYLNTQRQEKFAEMFKSFINAKDDNGNAKHAYFEDVKDEMVSLLRSGLAKDYEDAYNQALWRVESVRDKLIAEKAKAGMTATAATTQKAKTAAFEPSGKAEGAEHKRSLREEIRHNLAIYGE